MNKWTAVPALLTLGAVISMPVHAADIRFNGFASVVGGMTLNEGTVPGPEFPAVIPLPESETTFTADRTTAGIYDDEWSFDPDSNYGLQIMADLGDGLSVTAQITGAGGEDYEAEIQWAYISYDLAPETTLSLGRQRIPFFFYSDYLDVAYAYHWIRPPVEAYSSPTSNYNGVQLLQQFSLGDWDGRVQLYGGNAAAEAENREIETNNMIGVVGYIANDWLQLRATYLVSELWAEGSVSPEGDVQDRDNPVDTAFAGVAARAQLGNGFVVTEYTLQHLDEPVGTNFGVANEDVIGWYVSAGYTFGSVTPHITYAEKEDHYTDEAYLIPNSPLFTTDQKRIRETVTVGLRWDFHPSAAFKAEYSTSSDESTAEEKAVWGEQNEVDLFTLGVDVLF